MTRDAKLTFKTLLMVFVIDGLSKSVFLEKIVGGVVIFGERVGFHGRGTGTCSCSFFAPGKYT